MCMTPKLDRKGLFLDWSIPIGEVFGSNGRSGSTRPLLDRCEPVEEIQ